MMRFWKILFPVLTFLVILLILNNSLLPKTKVSETTTNIAGSIEEKLEDITENPVKLKDNHYVIISKMGHLFEYASFALFLSLSVFVLGGDLKEKVLSILFCVVILALADEQIQFLALERGSRVSDILIDLAAGMIGFGIAFLVSTFWKKRDPK